MALLRQNLDRALVLAVVLNEVKDLYRFYLSCEILRYAQNDISAGTRDKFIG